MILKILVISIFLLINIFIFYLWFWLFDNIFKIKNKTYIFFITLIFGIISGLIIVFYPHILNYTHFSLFDFTKKDLDILTNYKTLLLFWSRLSLVIFTIFLIVGKIKNIIFWKEFIIFSLIFILTGITSFKILSGYDNIYYIYVALGEEFSKFLLGIILFTRFGIIKSDIILFSILTAIGFAFIENLLYLFGILIGNNLLIQIFVGGLGLLISRGLVDFFAHSIFTGNIGFLTYKGLKQKSILLVILAIIVGISMHYFYDLLLNYGYKIVIIFLLIFGYIWISYLFYKSDRLYSNYYENNFYK